MARKKSRKNKKKSVKNKVTNKKKTVKKSVAKKSRAKKKLTKKKTVKKTTKKKTVKKIGLGRPIIPAEARLDHVFQKDYRAREIFAFLRVKTIRELEEFTPKDIVDLLAGPLMQTVERIRKTLALGNRSLAKDQKFALKFKNQWKTK